jgi:flagellar hook-length control protein FliK
MELLTSLPADLAVFADPSARGAAPLLRPPEGAGAPAVAATPFELCLALLTAGPPAGESWPASGKELPALPPDSADGDAAEFDPAALLAFAPALFGAALQAQLPSGEEPTPALPAATTPVQTSQPPLPQPQATLALPPPSGDTATADAAASSQAGDLELLATLTNADAAALALEVAEPHAGTTASRAAPPPPSWLEAFTREGRLQRPAAATATEQRAPAERPAMPPLAALQPNTATAAVVELTSGPQAGLRRVEVAEVLASPVTATDGASRTDWLPQPAGHSAATGGTAAAPQPPVDLRSPGWQEAFANRVQVLVDTQVGEARIKLNPPELGAVDVKISLVDDKTYVQLTTVTAAARDELAQSLPRLRELFTVSGLELGGASVHNGRDGQHGGYGPGPDRATANGSPLASFAADHEAPPLVPRRALGRIDVFA